MKALVVHFLSGGVLMGCLAVGFFFYRFWRKTKDELFGVFAASFWVLALERILLLATSSGINLAENVNEYRPYVYWVRFSAFMLIIVGFWLKNRRST